jgi:L-2-hydroxyglutarate oxidase LhgO
METVNTEVVVIGGGVVGIAVARQFAIRGAQVILVEKESSLGSGTSARNSGVIHAGLYYVQDSLKERLCLRGKQLLYQYCSDKAIPNKQIGKWIVAADGQEARLEEIYQRAVSNDVAIRRLSASELRKQAAELSCSAALDSPSTGIVDVQQLVQSLSLDFEQAGGLVHRRARVESLAEDGRKAILALRDGAHIVADLAINAAGLDALALLPEAASDFESYYLKGSYFSYSGHVPFKRLVYPIPANGGLGIHLTFDLSGAARFGPDARRVEEPEFSVVESDLPDFIAAISRYWPNCDPAKLRPDYSGVRPKLIGAEGVVDDYVFWGRETDPKFPVLSLLGVDSPGLTSCLAIAEYVFALVH